MAVKAGFFVVYNHIPALIAAVEANAQRAPKRVADKIAVSARARVPVDTGYLKSTIESVSVSRAKEAEVRVGAGYAGFVEYGTYKMAAQPFLGPAVDEFKDEFMLDVAAPVLGKRTS